MYPASDSHTGCVANNTVLETKWHTVITKRYPSQVSSDLKRQVITLGVQLNYPVWLLPRKS